MKKAFKVYHADKMAFHADEPKKFPDEFHIVAVVAAKDLEEAYYLTNSIHCAWWENEGVAPVQTETRSTSIGDIIMDNEGKFHKVDTFGFTEINVNSTAA